MNAMSMKPKSYAIVFHGIMCTMILHRNKNVIYLEEHAFLMLWKICRNPATVLIVTMIVITTTMML